MGRGRAGKPTLPASVLRRRIQETYGNSIPSVDRIAESFREKYPEYRRQKLERLTGMVRKSLELNSSEGKKRKEADKNDEEEENLRGGMCKKAKKKTRDAERGRMEVQSESESKSSFDGSAVAEDEVYSFEPEFDLTKSMLRNKYNHSEKKKVDSTPVKKDDGNGKEAQPMFKNLGGMDDVLNRLKKQVLVPLYHPEVALWAGFKPTTGILLHGPPGSGKSTLARAIANETGFSFYEIAASQLVSGVSGASEENIRELFSKAYKTRPSVVFIDEIEVIASKRENHHKEMESRIVTQIMACMDESRTVDDNQGHVLVIGATNRPDAVDRALRRPGRFDREIALGVPDENARLEILKLLTPGLRVAAGDDVVDLVKIARATPGFVGADLVGLVNEAASLAMMRVVNQLLVELHGADQREGVYVIGATNRWWTKHFGRLGTHLYVPLPNEQERGSILKALVGTKWLLDADVDLLAIGRSEACGNFSGADLFSLVNEAAMASYEERCNKMESATESSLPLTIKTIHFEQAFRKVHASVSEKQRKSYHHLSKRF